MKTFKSPFEINWPLPYSERTKQFSALCLIVPHTQNRHTTRAPFLGYFCAWHTKAPTDCLSLSLLTVHNGVITSYHSEKSWVQLYFLWDLLFKMSTKIHTYQYKARSKWFIYRHNHHHFWSNFEKKKRRFGVKSNLSQYLNFWHH